MPPSEQPSIIPINKLIKIILYVIFFVSLVNLLAYFYLQYFNPNKAYALIQHKWEILKKSSTVDWLILGDSSGNQGVDPKWFKKKENVEALNVCTIADLLIINDLWQLESVVKQGNKPKNILLVHTYDIWHRDQIPTGYASQIPAIPSDFPLSKYAISNVKRLVMNALPINFQRASLGHVLQHSSLWGKRNYGWEKDGFECIEKADIKEVRRDAEVHLEFVKNNNLKISTINEQALMELANLAKAEGIKVYLTQAPYYFALAQDENFINYQQDLEGYLKSFCEKNNWTYLADIQMFSESEMENADHVTMEGAQEFTKGILKQL